MKRFGDHFYNISWIIHGSQFLSISCNTFIEQFSTLSRYQNLLRKRCVNHANAMLIPQLQLLELFAGLISLVLVFIPKILTIVMNPNSYIIEVFLELIFSYDRNLVCLVWNMFCRIYRFRKIIISELRTNFSFMEHLYYMFWK